MFTYNVQYADFRHDQVQEMGPVDLNGAVAAFRSFPLISEFSKGTHAACPTAPTLSFWCQADGAVLAVWIIGSEPKLYEVYMEYQGKRARAEMADEDWITGAITFFFTGDRGELFAQLTLLPPIPKLRFWKALAIFLMVAGVMGGLAFALGTLVAFLRR